MGEDWKQFIKKICPKAKVSVINNAIKIPEIMEKNENTIPQMLFLGALIKRKGVLDLLQALKELIDKRIFDFKLLIAGAGEEEAELKKYVIDNNLSKQVEFLGWITKEDKANILKEADILILPSYNEGLPIAILEAMAYALPVISTNVGSIAEAVIDNQNGYLINPGDIKLLAEKIQLIISDREKWKIFSLKSRKLAENKFSEDVFISKINKLYRCLYREKKESDM